ncbi:hypothetical protein ACYSNU_01460 [Enterococcus sp. LJL120]
MKKKLLGIKVFGGSLLGILGIIFIGVAPQAVQAEEVIDITPTVSFTVSEMTLWVGGEYTLNYQIENLYDIPVEAEISFTNLTPETLNYADTEVAFYAIDEGAASFSYQVELSNTTMEQLSDKFPEATFVQKDVQPILELYVNYQEKNIYRLYNPHSGEHLYTAGKTENDFLISLGWHGEGTMSGVAMSPYEVYRLYNPYTGNHFYTSSAKEVSDLSQIGWVAEGTAFYTSKPSDAPVYRLYNPYSLTGAHFYTTSATERDGLIAIGWQDEGVGWYQVK